MKLTYVSACIAIGVLIAFFFLCELNWPSETSEPVRLQCDALVKNATSVRRSENDHDNSFDPSGLHFHAWTGTSAGTEWALVYKIADSRYRLTDWIGNGFEFELSADLTLKVLDSESMSSGRGRFTKDGRASFDWKNWGMSFQSRTWRAESLVSEQVCLPLTAVKEFEDLSGDWKGLQYQVSPATGQLIGKGMECAATVSCKKNGEMRFDWDGGGFDQGLMTGRERAVFHVFKNAPVRSTCATPVACETSRELDIFGVAKLVKANTIEFDVFAQTRSKVGDQRQFHFRYLLEKKIQ